jgi:hypothetical protein
MPFDKKSYVCMDTSSLNLLAKLAGQAGVPKNQLAKLIRELCQDVQARVDDNTLNSIISVGSTHTKPIRPASFESIANSVLFHIEKIHSPDEINVHINAGWFDKEALNNLPLILGTITGLKK